MKKYKRSSKKIIYSSSEKLENKLVLSNDEFITFSFSRLTTNSHYNFDFFKTKQSKEKLKMYETLISKIIEIEQINWDDFIRKNKKTGMETIPVKEIKFNIPEDMRIEKVTVIRFNQQNYRIIGHKLNNQNVFMVFGFDFNYSAYNH